MTSQLDLEGLLPQGRLVIEASAGTGKTYSLSALVARHVAERFLELRHQARAVVREQHVAADGDGAELGPRELRQLRRQLLGGPARVGETIADLLARAPACGRGRAGS